jgi:uncharacterized membrane protein
MPGWPSALTAALLGATLLLLLLTSVDSGGPAIRGPLTLVVLGFVPGAAMLIRSGPRDLVPRIALAIGISLAVNTLGSLAMAWWGLWFSRAYLVVLTIVCAPALALDLAARLTSASQDQLGVVETGGEDADTDGAEPRSADRTGDDETMELRLPVGTRTEAGL